MKHTSYKEALEVANGIDAKLWATDFSPSGLVFVIHEEGTTLTFRSAFLKEWKEWLFIFTEHHGTHIYHRGDLSFWGQFEQKETEPMKDTGHTDTCEFCGKESKVEDLIYGLHPDWEREDGQYYSYCNNCRDIEPSPHRDFWRNLNSQQDWGFTWGKYDIEHIKKACATVMKEECVDKWLDTPSPSFRKTPRNAFDEGESDEIYLLVHQLGSGALL